MVSIPDGLTDNSPTSVVILVTLKKPSARKSISQFLALLDVKQELLSK